MPHLLYTTERVIVVGSFATSHHYCPMSVQPPSALTVTLSFVFQFIARHLLCTPERVIVLGSFATSQHYCPMCVQPSSAFTLTFPAYRLSFFPRAQPVVASLYKTTEDRREQMPVLCCIAYQEFPICAGYPCALNSTIFCRKCSIFPFQSLSQGPHLRCDNRRDLFGRDLVQQ